MNGVKYYATFFFKQFFYFQILQKIPTWLSSTTHKNVTEFNWKDRFCTEEKAHRQGLKRKQHDKGNHKAEKTHSLAKGETKDSVGKQLLLQAWVPRVAYDKTAKNSANTNT